jgi:hypothetical protein
LALDPNPETEPDPHDRSKSTAQAAVVTQCQEGTTSGAESALGVRGEPRQVSAAPDQQSRDAVAELDSHVATVRDGNEHEALVNEQTAECDAANDAPRDDHPDADPEP